LGSLRKVFGGIPETIPDFGFNQSWNFPEGNSEKFGKISWKLKLTGLEGDLIRKFKKIFLNISS